MTVQNIFDLGDVARDGVKEIAETLKAEPISQEGAGKVIAELKKICDGVKVLEDQRTVTPEIDQLQWTWGCPSCDETNEEEGPVKGKVICWNCDETFRVKLA